MIYRIVTLCLCVGVQGHIFDGYLTTGWRMGRQLREAAITTRHARSGLPAGLHWRSIDPDIHLGYRKVQRAGRWMVRWRSGVGYRQAPLATADDVLEADGANVLSFAQAVSTSRVFVAAARREDRAAAAGPVPSVTTACEDYSAAIEARQAAKLGQESRITRARLRSHVTSDPVIGAKKLHDLRANDISSWRVRLRAKKLAETTVRRISSDFRAALNDARVRHGERLPDRFIIEIKDGFAITRNDPPADTERPSIILPDEDVRALIRAAREIDQEEDWDGDLHRLVVGLAATGARFSQLARAPVAALMPDLERLMVPSSNKGRGNRNRPPVAVALGADVVQTLALGARGRPARDLLFTRWGYARAGGLKWRKAARRGWRPAELSEPFRAIARRAGLSDDVTAYALRHSSIVRGLRRHLPVRLVAALHDTSSEMIERYYSAYIVDALDAVAASAVVPLLEPDPAGSSL